MICAWEALLAILPPAIRQMVDEIGKKRLLELRLRIDASPEAVLDDSVQWLAEKCTTDDMNYIINAASHYSPWSAATISQGYITVTGGHRIGICGTAVCTNGKMKGIRDIESICIRVARDIVGLTSKLGILDHSILILGAPGWGKTTMLRDIIRNIAEQEIVGVVDERGEVFPMGFKQGKRMHIMRGCPKSEGIEVLLRTMGPAWIAVDEITAPEDCEGLIRAANCGIKFAATAHGASIKDLYESNVYRPLVERGIIKQVLLLQKDRNWSMERVE